MNKLPLAAKPLRLFVGGVPITADRG